VQRLELIERLREEFLNLLFLTYVRLHDQSALSLTLYLDQRLLCALAIFEIVDDDIGFWRANSTALACPMPESEPVMSATLPSRIFVMMLPSLPPLTSLLLPLTATLH
jgi:hypothetical protein